MSEERLYYDSHMHTPLCKHAVGHPMEYVSTADSMGLKGVIFTCHSPMPNGFSSSVRMAPHEFDTYVGLIGNAQKQAAGGPVDVKLGLESDYFPGMEPWLEELHQRAEFHYILGSVHPFLSEYVNRYFKEDPVDFQKIYFRHLAAAAETGLFDCISHPDIVKNMFAQIWDFEKVRDTVATVLDRIAKTGVSMELNTSGVLKRLPEMNPCPEMLELIRERGIPVVISSDSHQPERVGHGFRIALQMLEDAGFTKVSYYIERRRQDVKIADVLPTIAG